jgi:organic hydroperoxide reductase OsmC/OhrA
LALKFCRARGGAEFSYQKYPRDHTWIFDGGHTMTATAAPAYLSNPANVDPEEAFVASLSSCHMLTFLSIACKQKFVLDSYTNGECQIVSQARFELVRPRCARAEDFAQAPAAWRF